MIKMSLCKNHFIHVVFLNVIEIVIVCVKIILFLEEGHNLTES